MAAIVTGRRRSSQDGVPCRDAYACPSYVARSRTARRPVLGASAGRLASIPTGMCRH